MVEAPQAELQTVPKPEGRELPALPQIFVGSVWGGTSDEMVGESAPSNHFPVVTALVDQGSACTVEASKYHACLLLHRAVSLS